MSGNREQQFKSNVASEFEAWSRTYDQSLANQLLFRPCYLKVIEFLTANAPPHGPRWRMLDVGCGTGTLATMLAACDLPVDITGLDYSWHMAQVAESKRTNLNSQWPVHFISGDAEHLPFEDNTFDLVTCLNSFHHYPHQQKAVAQFNRVLRPGGTSMLLDGYRDNMVGWVVFDIFVTTVEKHVHHCSAAEIREYFHNAGFTDLHQEKIGFFVPVLITRATAA